MLLWDWCSFDRLVHSVQVLAHLLIIIKAIFWNEVSVKYCNYRCYVCAPMILFSFIFGKIRDHCLLNVMPFRWSRFCWSLLIGLLDHSILFNRWRETNARKNEAKKVMMERKKSFDLLNIRLVCLIQFRTNAYHER